MTEDGEGEAELKKTDELGSQQVSRTGR